MKEDFVGYELAVKLKEKGFDWTCMAHFNTITYNEPTLNYNVTIDDVRGSNFKSLNKLDSFTDAPTISQVLKWLREEKKLYVFIDFCQHINKEFWIYSVRDLKDDSTYILPDGCKKCRFYEGAALAGIEFVLDNLI